MLPAPITEILSNVVALKLEVQTALAVVGAILMPLLRNAQTEITPHKGAPTQGRLPRPQRRQARRRRLQASAEPSDGPRERARAALRENPDATLTALARAAKCSRSTIANARRELAGEAKARNRLTTANPTLAKQSERRERAQRFLRAELAHGPKRVSDVEEAAEKARIDVHTLEQARGDLGIVTSRGNTGNTLSVQWSLPG
jgi:hypothetical protein